MGKDQEPPAISALPILSLAYMVWKSGSSQPSQLGTSALLRNKKCHCLLGNVSEMERFLRWRALQRQLWHGFKVKEELVHCGALRIQIPGRLSDIQVVQMAVPALAPTCLQPLSPGACVPLGLHLRFLFVWLLPGFFCGCCFFNRTSGSTCPNLTAGRCTLCSQTPRASLSHLCSL